MSDVATSTANDGGAAAGALEGGAVPPTADQVLTVVHAFDRVLHESPRLDAVLVRGARIAGGPVGIRSASRRVRRWCEPGRPPEDGDPPAGATVVTTASGDEVWMLDRPEASAGLPVAVVLDRLAVTCSIVLDDLARRVDDQDEAALVAAILTDGQDATFRAAALRALRLPAASSFRVLAMLGPAAAVDEVVRQLGGSSAGVRVGREARAWLVVTPGELPPDLGVPIGARLGFSAPFPASALAAAARQARLGMRYSLPSPRPRGPYTADEAVAVDAAAMGGGFQLLAEQLTADAINRVPEVQVLDRLAAETEGRAMLRTLEVVAATESFRRAAAHLHLHHNSVGHRTARAERLLGFSVNTPYGRFRLMLALVMQRLRDFSEGEADSSG
ncbi:helix-turn-helix domain-containing protein [Nakamurella leprariae]|uniref:Helix-turn-helix domain-containing protein n=1 Tax=Nakamurella leprariae TaxID=2803911 RepID=A0A938YEL6_9ACTN|nr:helix-turn-helix domain-containing protein [Nakamurella leprariae]MBM9466430.1 helix-turn-helix domain-containing protein [Nakamurella leprariae]